MGNIAYGRRESREKWRTWVVLRGTRAYGAWRGRTRPRRETLPAANAYTAMMSKSGPRQNPQPPPKPGVKRTGEGIETGRMAPRIANRRAMHDYFILDRIECGIALVGSEVKSVRQGKVQLGQSFARIRGGQVFLMGCHIEEYVEANQLNHDPIRPRRLLLHRREIRRLIQRLQKESGGGKGGGTGGGGGKGGGATLIPLEMYFRRGYVKVLLGIAKGKHAFDKRQAIREREDARNMEKALRRR
jgi:SsrA-binding protein